jgi:hypothetical protein
LKNLTFIAKQKMAEIAGYQNHLVAFVDLLGFSEKSFVNDDIKTYTLELVKSLAAARSEFAIKTEKKENGTSTQVIPAISTFSDHVVISYPIDPVREHLPHIGLIITFLQEIISRIAVAALPLGFMIRGGATVGPLYHVQGVVFGEALIEAHRLESSIAIYPRIAVSPNLLKIVQKDVTITAIAEDFDGIHYFDYLKRGILNCATPGDLFQENFRGWVHIALSTIQQHIDLYTQNGDLKKLAKWKWFSNYFNFILSSEPARIFLEKEKSQIPHQLEPDFTE